MIELSSGELTKDEKRGILSVLLEYHKRDKSKVNIPKCCDAYKANIGFPYSSFLFAADKCLFELQEKFFAKPVQFFKEALGAMSKGIKAALLFLFYKQGKCSEKDLRRSTKKASSQNEETLAWISDLIGVQEEMSLTKVRDSLEDLAGVYITHLNKSFTFAHNIVYESVALMHAERYPEEVIEHCTWNFIKGCVVTVATQDVAQLVIGKDLYENLCSRFIESTITGDLLSGNLYDMRTHPTMQTRDVCVTLYKMLQKQGKVRQFLTNDNREWWQGFLYGYLQTKGKDDIPFLVEEAIPYLKCTCDLYNVSLCWKCNTRNYTARAACLTGDISSYKLMLEEGITVSLNSIRPACDGMNPELLKLVISTIKDHGQFDPEDICVSKSLVVAKKSNVPEMYDILTIEGAVAMPVCVYDAVTFQNLVLVDHFVKELKRNGKWDTSDYWLQKALEESISYEKPDILNLLIEEGLKYHRGCILSAVKSKQIAKVQKIVIAMKATGSWRSSDWSHENEMKQLTYMLQKGEENARTSQSLADVGVSEALVEAKYYEDKSIYEYLLEAGVQLTMETLPPVVQTKQQDLVKDVIKELKDQHKWDPTVQSCTKAMFHALRQDLEDIFNVLVQEGIACTMDLLPLHMSETNITVSDIETLATRIKSFGNWQPNSVSMQSALIEAFQRKDKSIFNFLIANGANINPSSLLAAVVSHDTSTVSMCLQVLKASPSWNPSDPVLNMCIQLVKVQKHVSAPEIYAMLIDAGIGYTSESLLSASKGNHSMSMMMTINELIEAGNWNPETDSNVTRSLEMVCHHNNMMMFNVLQKKGAKLNEKGIFNIIQRSSSLWYNTGPESRKIIKGIPTLTALVTASIAKQFLVHAFQQKAITVYVRLIHALEETGKLDDKDPLLRDALEAAVESRDILAFNIAMETGTKMTEDLVLKLLLSIKSDFRIEVPERLVNKTYKTCTLQCLLESIRKENLRVLEETALLMKENTLWCPNDQRIVKAISDIKPPKQEKIIQKLVAFEFLPGTVVHQLISKPQETLDAENSVESGAENDEVLNCVKTQID